MKKILFNLAILIGSISWLAFNSPTEFQEFGMKAENNAFKSDELLKYRIHYGFVNAAVVKMSVSKPIKINNQEAYNLKIEGSTVKSFSWLFNVRDKFESWVDAKSFTPLRYAKTVREDDYFNQDVAIYNYKDKWLKNKEGKIDITDKTMDIAAAIYYLRNWDYNNKKVGDKFPLDIYLDNKIHNLSVTYAGEETLKTDVGKIKCIKLKPQLVVDRVFKDEDAMTVWVTNDKNHIPVRIQTDIHVGSLKVDLMEYQNLRNPFNSLIKK
jgi:hypothetical protein